MHTWSKMKSKLEKEHLADSLKGHITYFATSFSKAPDHWGRAAILLDGKEVIEGSYCELWSNADLLPKDETLNDRLTRIFPYIDETAVKYGQFDQRCFYYAFEVFDNQSIEKSLESDDLIVRIFAVLDKRVGKRRLLALNETTDEKDEIFRTFLHIRMAAEGMDKKE